MPLEPDSGVIHQFDGMPTEDSIAQAFESLYKDDLIYDHTHGLWYQWLGIWREERTQLAFHWARLLCREFNKANRNSTLAKAATAGNVERLARTARCFAQTAEIWNRDPYLLGTPGGTVNLRTGIMRESWQEDYISKCTAVIPEDKPIPVWNTFLDQVTQGDKDLQRFLQQIAGYCLTGDISEHILIFIFGAGGNGKSVYINTQTKILGDYHVAASMETFTSSKHNQHPTELAWLHGARMVTASETEEGRAWAESRIKQLTGGDPIAARYMRQDFFQYQPQFKLVFLGNHKPRISNPDEAMRRRFFIVPFNFKPPEVDKHLPEKLAQEYPGILHWMIQGCLDWQKNGLIVPESVKRETDAYFSDQDIFSHWLDECTERYTGAIGESSSRLWESWKYFAIKNGVEVKTVSAFKEQMQRAGFIYKDRLPGSSTRGYLGITLKVKDYRNKDPDY